MTSFSLNRAATQPPYPACSLPSYPLLKPLKNRWSHGRGYFVIALIAPLLLSSLLLIYLHNTTKARLLGR
ncbi:MULTISPECIES: hypothetical protein [Cyanophyceae]|uniref:hypothetical protein n=1 Tax=Cyanophyceae TaxID=3028117 RepID=UPI001684AC27|nr:MULTISPECIES: hypothetical protein [Cyanophyceae]MBD1915728.1 hypothetical protein [Phormidium sp. FACHB-77]MBD2029023.1 hypothetical protein [Phormidium sp. FACHB-322]MBD2052220.1 hypothetical protein [Leptolyngbya sp. FACHB-60]